MKSNQESPFNAEYIDQLLSGASADKVPEVLTEQPMKLPKKCRPTPKERPHRWILILTAVLAAFLVLSLSLPELVAAVGSNRWQARAEEAYSELIGASSHHLKLHHIVERVGEARQEQQSERWIWRNDHLYITKESGRSVSYELERSGHRFRKKVSPEDPDAKWIYQGSTHYETISRPKTLAEANYTIHSVHGTLTGTEVTCLKNGSKNEKITFRFDWDGTLVGFTVFRKTDSVPYLKAEYTLLQTDSKEILDKIKEAYREAIQDKANQN